MADSTPCISVIIPVYNGSMFLAEAIRCVHEQRYVPLEIIIVDDGSIDDTAQLVTQLGADIRYVFQENGGPAAARNRGLSIARGDFIAFLDVDDLWPAHKLQLQASRLVETSGLEVVLGRIKYVRLAGAAEVRIQLADDDTLAYVHLGSGLFKRSVFEKVGDFDETLRYSEDHDWFLRARENGVQMTILDEVTLYYRLHEHNMTRDKKRVLDRQLVKVLKKSLDRRRSRSGGPVEPVPKFYDHVESK
jgi:glycosyltransferase involved in cell wall biosynthesis